MTTTAIKKTVTKTVPKKTVKPVVKKIPTVPKTKIEHHVSHAVKPKETGEKVLPKTSYDFIATVGRRKEAVARVRLYAKGSGQITINNLEFQKYFSTYDYQLIVMQPLKLVGLDTKVDIRVKVSGGGKTGQAEAVRHGIARAILILDEELRKNLRTAGFLTRDSRVKERKKYGLKKARRAPQFSKR
jgi:small subunit ribosomal protein S9